jgi:hypothetical protein
MQMSVKLAADWPILASDFTTEPGQIGRGNQTPRNTEMRSADFISKKKII